MITVHLVLVFMQPKVTSAFLAIEPTRYTNFSIFFYFWNETVRVSDSFCKQDQDGTVFHSDPARRLSANLYDIYHCCVYSEKPLMMDIETA
jgi:hypothetical protein